MMKIIYCRGGSKTAPEVATEAGVYLGTRHDYKTYAKIHMLDVNWKRVIWHEFMTRVFELKPTMALVPDFEHPSQFSLLCQRIYNLEQAGVPEILVCPKFHGAIDYIPPRCIVALSVPAPSYAGFLPDLRKLKNRKVHLLGGRADINKNISQAELIIKLRGLGADVVSIDNSHISVAAAHGRWFDGTRWIQSPRNSVSTHDLEIASLKNISKYLNIVNQQKQLTLAI